MENKKEKAQILAECNKNRRVIQMICSEKERERIKINLKNNTIEKQEDMKNIAEYIDYLEQENAELKTQRDYYKREYSLYNKTLKEAGKALTKK